VSARARTVLRGFGQLLVTAGVVVLLFCVYELEVTNLYTSQKQQTLNRQLTDTWQRAHRNAPDAHAPSGPLLAAFRPGEGIARIYLPTLGRDQVHVVVEGVSHDDLTAGPGHYPGTALPGEIGNVVISGHRTTYGQPFNRVDELRTGAPVVLETADAFFTYDVISETVVEPNAVGVILPVPNKPGVAPSERLLTLTTCNPKYSAQQRLIVRARLVSRLTKTPGATPPALQPAR
jgi:sortase A